MPARRSRGVEFSSQLSCLQRSSPPGETGSPIGGASRPPLSGQRFAAELVQPDRDEECIEDDEPDEQTSGWQVMELRHQRAAKAFARVDHRIDEYRARENG